MRRSAKISGKARSRSTHRTGSWCPAASIPHAHIEQVSGGGLLNADTFESATTSAAFGGTTTVIPFAAQHIGLQLDRVVADYHQLAERGAVIDYAFHMILADPNETTLKVHLPKLVKEGHASIKFFMTYDRIKLDDEQILDVLQAARDNGAFVCAHAENHGMISFMVKRLLAQGLSTPTVLPPEPSKAGGSRRHPAAGDDVPVHRPADHDLSRLDRTGRRRGAQGARRRRQDLRGDLPALSVADG